MVTLEGWPLDFPFAPKQLSLTHLRKILKGLLDNRIYYRAMTEEEIERAQEQADKAAAIP
jgi:hypothetical protein